MNNKRTSKALRVLVLVLALLLIAGAAMAASYKAKVMPSSVKVYTKAATSSKLMGSLKKGTEVTIVSYSSKWAKINYKGYTGYTELKNLRINNRITAYTTKAAPVYKQATGSSKKLGTAAAGTRLYVSGRDGNYFMVENEKGSSYGYIHQSYLSTKAPAVLKAAPTAEDEKATASAGAMASTSGGSSVDKIIAAAQNQLGKPYSYSPTAPNSFDCSRLVKYCYKQAGYSLSGSAKDQGYNDSYTKISSVGDLRVGDIVCFNTNETDGDLSDHTGIYIGNGQFIHASSGAGNVIISDLTSGYYKEHFSWGRRVIN